MEASQTNIPSHMGLSIFNMLCCCLPLGIAAVIYSHKVDEAMRTGDFDRASSSSRTACTLNTIGIITGIIVVIIVIVLNMPRKDL